MEAAALLRKDISHVIDIAGGADAIPPALLIPAELALHLMATAHQ
jgi:hypothetical protein